MLLVVTYDVNTAEPAARNACARSPGCASVTACACKTLSLR